MVPPSGSWERRNIVCVSVERAACNRDTFSRHTRPSPGAALFDSNPGYKLKGVTVDVLSLGIVPGEDVILTYPTPTCSIL